VSDLDELLKTIGFSGFENKKAGRITVAEKERRTADGIVFDSMIEKDAYLIFKEKIGKKNFVIQPKFKLQDEFIDPDGVKHRPIYYIADFAFYTRKTSFDNSIPTKAIIVDIKGMQDSVFKLKHKMFLYKFNKKLYLPKTKKHILELVEIIKNESVKSKN
jgi:hypothetical protein